MTRLTLGEAETQSRECYELAEKLLSGKIANPTTATHFNGKGIDRDYFIKTYIPQGEFQDLKVGEALEPLYQVVARNIAKSWNENGNCAVVVGATYPKELARVKARHWYSGWGSRINSKGRERQSRPRYDY